MIPSSFTLHMPPANAPGVRKNIDICSTRPAGYDTEPLHQSAVNDEWRLEASEVELCAGTASIATVDSWSRAVLSRELAKWSSVRP